MSLTMTRPQIDIAKTGAWLLTSNDTPRAHNRFLMVNDLVRTLTTLPSVT